MTVPEEPDFWENRFHTAALTVGFVAAAEGWLHDSLRVRTAVYALYETGDWPAEADDLTTA